MCYHSTDGHISLTSSRAPCFGVHVSLKAWCSTNDIPPRASVLCISVDDVAMGQTPAWHGSWTSVTWACFSTASKLCIVAFAAAPAQGDPLLAPNTANPTRHGARTADDDTRVARILRELPPHPLVPKAGPTVWTATQWKSPVHVMNGCPRQLPRPDVMSEWSVRQRVRLVWQDNGRYVHAGTSTRLLFLIVCFITPKTSIHPPTHPRTHTQFCISCTGSEYKVATCTLLSTKLPVNNCRCIGTGHVDAGTCLNQSGQIRCFPSFIVFGTAKGGTAELQSW